MKVRQTKASSPLLLSCSILSALLTTSSVCAGAYVWKNVVIGGGGYMTGVEYHPKQKGLAYARTDVGGVYRRDKADGPWIALNDMVGGQGNEFMKLGVLSMALDPVDSSRIYLACGQYTQWWAPAAVFMASADRGATWTEVELPFRLGGNQVGRGTGERLAVDPSDGTRLLLGTNEDGLWRGTGCGLNWTRLTSFPPTSTTFVRYDPAHPGTVYAGAAQTTGPSLWKSTDGGDTWTAVPGQPEGLMAHQTAIDAEGNLHIAYSDTVGPGDATKGALWKLTPDGKWESLNAPEGNGGYGGISLDRSAPGRIFVSTLSRWWPGDEVYRSDDGGKTWTGILAEAKLDHSSAPWAASLKPHWISDIEIDPFTSGRATFVTGYGLYTTREAGKTAGETTWFFDNKGIEECVPLGLVSPASGPPLISVIGDFDGFRHDDLFTSPSGGRHSPHNGTSVSLDGAGAAPDVLARLHGSKGSITRDGARTWKDFPSSPPSSDGGRIAVSADGSTLLWCPKEGSPHFSNDDGATWNPSSGIPGGKLAPAADRVMSRLLFIYDSETRRIYRSLDHGATFKPVDPVDEELPEGGSRIKSVPGQTGHLWHAAGRNGLWRSSDGGSKFHRAPAVDAAYEIGFGKPAPGETYPAAYMWGSVDGAEGFFRSDDRGATWKRINDDRHRFGYINDLTGDPRVFGRVYLGTSGRGVIVGAPAARR